MKKQIFILVLGLLFLISCIPQNASEDLLTPTDSIEVTKIPTLLSTIVKITETPQIVSTMTLTPTTKKSATPFSTEESLKAITEDGKWEISFTLGYGSTVQVTSVNGKTKWVLDETTLPDARLGQLWNYKTSNDRNSIYFALSPYDNDTLILRRWPPNYGLYKLNLINGKVETILGINNSSKQIIFSYFALSPDESQIIYSWSDKPTIILRNVNTFYEQTIPLPDNYKIAGPFVWSPNGKSVIFTTWIDALTYPTNFLVVRMNIENKSMHYLYSDNEKNRFFVPTEWIKDDLVYLLDHRYERWQINPFTGKLQKRIQATP